jgi:hypothetical protein
MNNDMIQDAKEAIRIGKSNLDKDPRSSIFQIVSG